MANHHYRPCDAHWQSDGDQLSERHSRIKQLLRDATPVLPGNSDGHSAQTVVTCYDATGTPVPANCPTTAVTPPINRKSRFVYLPDSAGRQSETDSYFNGFGLQTELDEYDFGSAAVGPLVRKIITSYVSLGNNITTVSSVSVKDPSNNIVAQTTYAYDETAVTTTSGTPQHGNINGARGNLTTLATQVNATQTLYRKFTYYDTGTLNSSTDASLSSTTNGATTTYVYGSGTSCGNSLPTQINLPLSLSRSMTWNCSGGVQLTATDENGNTVTTGFHRSIFLAPRQRRRPTQ